VQSLIHGDSRHRLLFELDSSIQTVNQSGAYADALLQLTRACYNLLHQWAETYATRLGRRGAHDELCTGHHNHTTQAHAMIGWSLTAIPMHHEDGPGNCISTTKRSPCGPACTLASGPNR
jgi:hypothetical protein